jgi:hypothetical protein
VCVCFIAVVAVVAVVVDVVGVTGIGVGFLLYVPSSPFLKQ